MSITMQSGKTIEINESHAIDIRKTSNGKWMIYEVEKNWGIGVLDNLGEAAAALESIKLFIGRGQDWDFNQYIKGELDKSEFDLSI